MGPRRNPHCSIERSSPGEWPDPRKTGAVPLAGLDPRSIPGKGHEMLRMIVVPKYASEVPELLTRCRQVAARWGGGDTETVVVMNEDAVAGRWLPTMGESARFLAVPLATGAVDRLDAGLFLRPLPEQVIVVGRDATFSAAEVCFVLFLLELRSDLAAITSDSEVPNEAEMIAQYGGAFRAGALLSAGAFRGDGRRRLHARLTSLGYDTVAMLPTGALSEDLSA